MTVSIRVEGQTGLAIATCSGVLRCDDAREGALALWKTPDWAGRSVVWDFREARFDVTAAEVRDVARFVLQHQPAAPRRIAFVTPRDADYGRTRMFGVYREDPRTGFRVFRDFGEALAWARSPDPDVP